MLDASLGGVAERLNAPVLKTGGSARASWVRIPPPPPSSARWSEATAQRRMPSVAPPQKMREGGRRELPPPPFGLRRKRRMASHRSIPDLPVSGVESPHVHAQSLPTETAPRRRRPGRPQRLSLAGPRRPLPLLPGRGMASRHAGTRRRNARPLPYLLGPRENRHRPAPGRHGSPGPSLPPLGNRSLFLAEATIFQNKPPDPASNEATGGEFGERPNSLKPATGFLFLLLNRARQYIKKGARP